ncbi:MAG: cobalamin-dependent protein [Anaerolineales bacterium]|jgi:methylmalonyl-CoA mutase cobalamin-binding domain/chain
MSEPNSNSKLAQLVAELEEDTVLELVKQRLEAGDDPLQIINECNLGMREVGKRYEQGEYFVAGLIMSGEIFREVVELVQPLIEQQSEGNASGRVLVGTVSGDIHDIGKNMFGMLLTCHGFRVIDLGVDVPPDVFAAKVVETKPDIVGLSGLITASFEMMKETVTTLRKEAKKHNLSFPIIVGGGMIDDQVRQYVGADYWMPDAMAGVRLCEELLGNK